MTDKEANTTPTPDYYSIEPPPPPVGFWCLDGTDRGTCLGMLKKPTDEQIKNTEAMFGWKWKDAK